MGKHSTITGLRFSQLFFVNPIFNRYGVRTCPLEISAAIMQEAILLPIDKIRRKAQIDPTVSEFLKKNFV